MNNLNERMTPEEIESFLKSTEYAIVAVNKENTSIFSFAFFDSVLTEEDFFETRSKLLQSGRKEDFKLRMATKQELVKARNAYLKDVHKFKVDYFEYKNDKPQH